MQDKTSNHAPIPTELNIAPRGKSWLHGQLIDGEQGHPTRQSMESADRAQAIEAAPAQAAPAAVVVPDGWKLVPVDLTPEMKREFMDLLMDGIDIYVNCRDQIEIQTDSPRRIWKAVLALSPAAPKAQADARDALTHAELLEVKRAISDFEDSNETDVPYELLMRAARAGYLECAYFEPLSNSTLDDDIDRAAIATQAELASQDEHERHADWVDDTHASLEARDAKIAAQAAQQGGDEQ